MKKLKLFALGMIGASMMMTSCAEDSDDPAVGPTLTITEENSANGVVNGKVSIEPGDSIHFRWDSRAGDAKLETFAIEYDGKPLSISETDEGNDLADDIKNADNESYQDGVWFDAGSTEGSGVYSFTVTDKDGESTTVDIEVVVESAQLSAEAAFQWKRVGGAAGTGLDQFGLKWENNSSVAAIIATDAASLFVELPSSAWANITTKDELITAMNATTPITKFEGVSSTTSNANLNIILATMVGTDVYILSLDSSTVTTGGSGTTITIDGMYKMGS